MSQFEYLSRFLLRTEGTNGLLHILCVLCIYISVASSQDNSTSAQFTEKIPLEALIPPDYESVLPPPSSKGGIPDDVNITIFVKGFHPVDELNHEFGMDLHFLVSWKDPRLRTEILDDKEEVFAPKSLDKLWNPDFYIHALRDYKTVQGNLIPRGILAMKHPYLLEFNYHVTVTIGCHLDFRIYPSDSQKCQFIIEMYSLPVERLKLKWSDQGIQMDLEDKPEDFNILISDYYEANNSRNSINYSELVVDFNLERRVGNFIVQVYIPSLLFFLTSWLSMLIPRHLVPGRMVLSITTLLVIVAMISGVRNVGPKTNYLKAIDVWMFACTVMVFIVLVVYIVVLKVDNDEKARGECPATGVRLSPIRISMMKDYTKADKIEQVAFFIVIILFTFFVIMYFCWLFFI